MRLPVDFGTPRLGLGQRPLGGGAQHLWRRRRRLCHKHGPHVIFISHRITFS
jgi:RecA-family ATPase